MDSHTKVIDVALHVHVPLMSEFHFSYKPLFILSLPLRLLSFYFLILARAPNFRFFYHYIFSYIFQVSSIRAVSVVFYMDAFFSGEDHPRPGM